MLVKRSVDGETSIKVGCLQVYFNTDAEALAAIVSQVNR